MSEDENGWVCKKEVTVTAMLGGLPFVVTAPAGDRVRFVYEPYDRTVEPISFELVKHGNQWLLASEGFGGNVRGQSGEAQRMLKDHGPPWLDCPEMLFPQGRVVEIRRPIRCVVTVLSAKADGRELVATVSPGDGVAFEWFPGDCAWSFVE